MMPFVRSGPADGCCPLLLTSPHSGTHLPPSFLRATRLPASALRRIEDCHVGALLAASVKAGLPLMEATHSRAYLDLNRAENELDPAMLIGSTLLVPHLTERVRRGYGLLPRVAAPNQPIYPGRIPASEAQARLAALHQPWHHAIAETLAAARAQHGYAILLDCHSMPTPDGANPPELVIGDLHGRSAAEPLVAWLEAAFAATGLKVARNTPYAGGHTTERHGTPADGQHAIQLEFDRSLYMNTDTLRPHAGFARLSASIAATLAALCEALPILASTLGGGTEISLAAE